MACEGIRRRNQTAQARKEEIAKAAEALDRKLTEGRVRVVVDRVTGAIAFDGWSGEERADVTDDCAYRIIMSTGSALARAEIARAEALAGRTVSNDALNSGVHSHDGGRTWHGGH